MASIGNLVVNLTANSEGLKKGLASAQAALSGFAAITVAAVGASVARFASVGSALDDMSQRTGLSVEALSGLSFAAKMSDTSLEGLQSGLVKMTKFMDGVESGSSAALQTLDQLGISVAELQGLSGEGKLKVFADALSQIEDTSQRSAMAMKVFGKGAVDLLPLLTEGAAGLTEMQKRAEELGLVMSDKDAKAAAVLGDQIDTLIMTADMAAVKIGSLFAPALIAAADGMLNLISNNQTFIAVAASMAAVIGTVAVAMKLVTLATQAYAKAKAVAMAIGGGPAAWASLAIGIGVATVATKALTETFTRHNSSLDQASASASKLDSNNKSLASSFNTVDAAAKNHASTMQQMRDSYVSYLPAAEQAKMKAADIAKEWYAAQKAGVQLNVTWDQMKRLQEATIQGSSGFTSAMAQVTDDLRVLRGEATETQIELEKMASFGVPQGDIDKLSAMMAERAALQEKSKADEAASGSAESEANRMAEEAQRAAESFRQSQEQMAESIKQGLKTPVELFADKINDIKALHDKGLLSSEQAFAAVKQAEKVAIEDTVANMPQGKSVGVASAMQRGSGEAFGTILNAAMNRGKDPVVMATEKQTKELIAGLKQKPVTIKKAPEFSA